MKDIHYTPDGTAVEGTMVPLGIIAPDTCPASFRSIDGAVIGDGRITVWGSVARWFIEQQRALDNACELTHSHVYFIQSVNGGPVKIGIAKSVSARLAVLQGAQPYALNIIATVPDGGREMEKKLHQRFADRRINGEWFDITKTEVEAAISDAI